FNWSTARPETLSNLFWSIAPPAARSRHRTTFSRRDLRRPSARVDAMPRSAARRTKNRGGDMSIAVTHETVPLAALDAEKPKPPVVELDPRTSRLLSAPITPMLLGLAWPNMLVMLAQTATGLIETWFISRLGTDALAGMALVFPCVMLMQMIS